MRWRGAAARNNLLAYASRRLAVAALAAALLAATLLATLPRLATLTRIPPLLIAGAFFRMLLATARLLTTLLLVFLRIVA
jgi:hypothetical protein